MHRRGAQRPEIGLFSCKAAHDPPGICSAMPRNFPKMYKAKALFRPETEPLQKICSYFAYSVYTLFVQDASGKILAQCLQPIHGLRQLCIRYRAGNAEMLLAGKAKNIAGRDENMRALEKFLAEFLG